jgi:UDP-GlcNAc:undecaprenyl-phosphate/decaprenyl-phosphate GlcNAc-1-phosphate transferase
MSVYGEYAVVAGIAAFATFLLGYPVRRFATAIGAVDQPGLERVHGRPVPTIGGTSMLLGFGAALLLASQLGGLSSIFRGSTEPLGVGLAALVIYAVGLIDDVRNISPPAKVAGQVFAAMVLVFLGVTMEYFKFPFFASIYVLSPSVLPLVTAIWVVGMANAVNLIDGLDGLAAGVVAIGAAALCVYGLRLETLGNLTPDNVGPLVAAITCGVCIGFLPHNFYPARQFMGDSGALFLGLLMAAATMVIGGRTTVNGVAGTDVSGLTFFRFAPLFIPIFILGVPILDTVFAIVRRTVRGVSVAERDLGHLHYRLIRLGHGQRRSVLILWAWTAVLSAFAILPTFVVKVNAFVPFVAAFSVAVLYTIFRPGGNAVPVVEPSAAPPEAEPTPEAAPPEPTTPAISVVMSAAAGVAVAGESDLASPRRRRRRRHVLMPRRRIRPPSDSPAPGTESRVVRFGESRDEMGG